MKTTFSASLNSPVFLLHIVVGIWKSQWAGQHKGCAEGIEVYVKFGVFVSLILICGCICVLTAGGCNKLVIH